MFKTSIRQLFYSHLSTTVLFFLLLANTAVAGEIPLGFDKLFVPDTMGPGSTSTLVFTIVNDDQINGVTELTFTDSLPAGVTIDTPSIASTDCVNGILDAPDGGSVISFSEGELGAGDICTVSVNVTSETVGVHMNVSGSLSSSAGVSESASDDLTVT